MAVTLRRWADSRRRRHKLLIRRVVEEDDDKGGYVSRWETIAEPWAEVEAMSGREAVIDQALHSIAVYRMRTRWRAGIKVADQVQYGSISLNITSAEDPDSCRRDLVIIATTEGARADAP